MNYIVIAIYALGYIANWKLVFVYLIDDVTYWNGKYYKPEPVDIILGAFMATLGSFIWPLFLIPYLLYNWIKPALNYYIDKNYADRE